MYWRGDGTLRFTRRDMLAGAGGAAALLEQLTAAIESAEVIV
jgi:hypothetical protein